MTASGNVRRIFRVCLLVIATFSALVPSVLWPRRLLSQAMEAALNNDSRSARVDSAFNSAIRSTGPGCAAGVAQGDTVLYEHGYGEANLDYNVPISPASTFAIASLSKQFTAATIGMLVLDRRISLDDHVRKYVPELSAIYEPVTVRELVHHSSGIRDYLALFELAGIPLDDTHRVGEVVALLNRQRRLDFVPGTRYSYSNSGYLLLGMIVQRVTHEPLRRFAEERIFGPLGMLHTHFRDDAGEIIPGLTTPYTTRLDGSVVAAAGNFSLQGDGGVVSTIGDMLVWDRELGAGRLPGGNVLKGLLLSTDSLGDGERAHYAFGLDRGEYGRVPSLSHSGEFVGITSASLLLPTRRLSIIVLCNSDALDPMALAKRMADIYAPREPLETRSLDANRPTRPPIPIPVPVPDSLLIRYVGAYEAAPGSQVVHITMTSGKVRFSTAGVSYELQPVSPSDFVMVNAPVTVHVAFLSAGSDTRVRISQDGQAPSVLQRVRLVSPDTAALRQYVGMYRSREIAATYSVVLRNARLMLQGPDGTQATALTPTTKNYFSASGFQSVAFARDRYGRAQWLLLSVDGASGIRFARIR